MAMVPTWGWKYNYPGYVHDVYIVQTAYRKESFIYNKKTKTALKYFQNNSSNISTVHISGKVGATVTFTSYEH